MSVLDFHETSSSEVDRDQELSFVWQHVDLSLISVGTTSLLWCNLFYYACIAIVYTSAARVLHYSALV